MGHKILFVGTIIPATITPELNIGKLKDFVKKIVYIGVIDLVGHFLIGIPAIFSKTFTKTCGSDFQSNTPLVNTCMISMHTESNLLNIFALTPLLEGVRLFCHTSQFFHKQPFSFAKLRSPGRQTFQEYPSHKTQYQL